MSWVCLPEQEGACLPAGCLAGGPFAQWKSNLTASECSHSARETVTSSPSLSGMTSEPSTASPGEAPLTSSAAASLVRTSAAQGEAQALAARARASGLRCCASLARFGLRGSLPKTVQCYALEVWRRYSKGLPASGMMQRGLCSELMTSVRRIGGSGSGLWPTPTTIGNELTPSMQKHAGHRRLIADLMLPTPIASDGKGQRGAGSIAKGGGRRLTDVGASFLTLREWMMGWPIGWSASAPLATDRFRLWLRSRSEFLARLSDE